ncbi:MAG: hypothetical protein ACLU5J_02280 [Christensenellales bacterium]
MWTSADPATLNHLNYADSVESDFLSLTAGQLMSFEWNDDTVWYDGVKLKCFQ